MHGLGDGDDDAVVISLSLPAGVESDRRESRERWDVAGIGTGDDGDDGGDDLRTADVVRKATARTRDNNALLPDRAAFCDVGLFREKRREQVTTAAGEARNQGRGIYDSIFSKFWQPRACC